MDDEIKLPSSSFDELAKIIQGYAQLDRETSLDDISRAIGMNHTIVSGNNGFLVSVGIVEGGQKKSITPAGKKLGHALSHEIEDEVRTRLKEIVDNSEFLKNLVAAVRIRRGMDESALRAHVAYSAGQGRTPRVSTGAGTVVELLRRAGVIEERDGKFVAVLDSSATTSPSPASETSPRAESSPHGLRLLRSSGTAGGIAVSIQIEVKCEPKDLEGLGKKLRRVVEDFEARASSELSDNPSSGEKS